MVKRICMATWVAVEVVRLKVYVPLPLSCTGLTVAVTGGKEMTDAPERPAA